MKKYFIVAAIVIAVIALGGFAYKAWSEAKMYKDLYNQQIDLTGDAEKNYNRAKVILSDKDIKINALDTKLRKAIGKTRVVKEVIYIKVEAKVTGAGKAIKVTPELYTYKDFRLAATLDTISNDFSYFLSQHFKMNLYELEGNDYRAELLEINGDTGKAVTSHEIRDFIVIKKPPEAGDWHFGTNMMIGISANVNKVLEVTYPPYVQFNFISYGKSHLDSSWRFGSLGINTDGGLITPASYRISNLFPVINDMWVDVPVTLGFDKQTRIGVGISSTF